jgi:adenine deaminase
MKMAKSPTTWKSGHFNDVAQDLIDRFIHFLDFFEFMTQAEALYLGLEIGILAAGISYL